MKKTLLALSIFIAFASAASAQFQLTTFDGKTVRNTNKPSVTLKEVDSTLYYTWETDFVRIQWVTHIGNKLAIDETLLYYMDADTTMPKLEEIPGSAVGADLKSKKGATIPHYNWREDAYSQKMDTKTTVMFATKADARAFMDRLAQKKKSAKVPGKRILLKSILKEKK